jgi:superfamily I DNA/RNA helicase
VDEYQDLNKADQTLIDKLAESSTLTVIGDDSQSIYGFRYANPEGIRTFPNTHPGTTCYTIEVSRRCPPNIVAMSNALIANDSRRLRAEPLEADPNATLADVYLVQHESIEDEVGSISDFIAQYLSLNPNTPPGQVLVLTPRRFIGNAIRDALIDRRLNATSYYSEDALSSEAAAEGFCLLTLLVDSTDRTALRTWIGMNSTNARVRGYQRLQNAAQERQVEPAELLAAIANGDERVPHTNSVVTRWEHLQQRLAQLSGLEGLDLARALWPEDDEDCADIRLVAEIIAVSTPEPENLLEALSQEITQPDLPDSKSDIIRVMSLHKSKGLTATLVVVAGCMAGALPHIDEDGSQADQDFQLEEQRRLFYVAITRSAGTLVISSCRAIPAIEAFRSQVTIVRHDPIQGLVLTAASPFIAELGASAPRPITTSEWRAIVGF